MTAFALGDLLVYSKLRKCFRESLDIEHWHVQLQIPLQIIRIIGLHNEAILTLSFVFVSHCTLSSCTRSETLPDTYSKGIIHTQPA